MEYGRQQDLWDRIWKDKNDRLVIWQKPNVWLIGWAVLTCISLFFTGRAADVFSAIGSVSLITWALLEVFKGDSYFRRVLGLVVLIFSIASLVKTL